MRTTYDSHGRHYPYTNTSTNLTPTLTPTLTLTCCRPNWWKRKHDVVHFSVSN